MAEFNLKVKGMVCGGCENRIKNALGTIDGITEVEANHETGEVKVIAEGVEQKTIEEKIEDIGFNIE